ncbi:MAG: ATP-binding cassette domain-containing protein, partial [Spirochaetota bacterium]
MSDNDILLEVNNLKMHFPVQKGLFRRTVGHVKAVDGVTFAIREGETLGLVGESGCGKTTTGRCILRALDPTEGEIKFRKDGEMHDLAQLHGSELNPFRTEMQIIFQDPFSSLNPRMTVGNIVSEPLLVHNVMNKSQRKDYVAELLEKVGLNPFYINRYPHEFS